MSVYSLFMNKNKHILHPRPGTQTPPQVQAGHPDVPNVGDPRTNPPPNSREAVNSAKSTLVDRAVLVLTLATLVATVWLGSSAISKAEQIAKNQSAAQSPAPHVGSTEVVWSGQPCGVKALTIWNSGISDTAAVAVYRTDGQGVPTHEPLPVAWLDVESRRITRDFAVLPAGSLRLGLVTTGCSESPTQSFEYVGMAVQYLDGTVSSTVIHRDTDRSEPATDSSVAPLISGTWAQQLGVACNWDPTKCPVDLPPSGY